MSTEGFGRLFRVVAIFGLTMGMILPSAGPAAPAGTTVNVRATFAGTQDGIMSKIVGGPYSGRTTSGILQIGRKYGALDLRFDPGSTPLIMSLDEAVNPGQCPADRPLPGSPFSISNLSIFTYKEVFLSGSCSATEPAAGYGISSAYLNLLGMVDAQMSLIQIHVRFEVAGYPDYFVMRPNKTDIIEAEFVGIVAVTATDLNPGFPGVDHWEFSPLACPVLPVFDRGEANIYQTYPVGRKTSGSCSQGDFVVPFLLVLDRI